MTRLQEILERKRVREETLNNALPVMVEQLVKLGVLKIVLFGSMLTGDIDPESDLDLLVIMPASFSGKEWSGKVYAAVERKVAADLVVFNEKELVRELPVNSFLREALHKGRVLYEKVL